MRRIHAAVRSPHQRHAPAALASTDGRGEGHALGVIGGRAHAGRGGGVEHRLVVERLLDLGLCCLLLEGRDQGVPLRDVVKDAA